MMVTLTADFLSRYSEATQPVNEQVLREAACIVGKDVQDFTQEDVLFYQRSLISSCGKLTQKRKLHTLSAYFKYLIDRDILTKNPTVAIRVPKSDRLRTIRWLSEADRNALIAQTHDPMVKAILATGLSGLRLAEIVSLNVEQFNDSRLWNVEGKGGKVRTVPLTNEVERIITDYLGKRTKGPMFRIGQHRINRRTVQNVVYRASEQILGRRIGPHVLRHTFATIAAKADIPVLKLGRILGHANPQITEIYVHLDDQDLLDAVRVLDKPVGRPNLRLLEANAG
jgi:integrase/recombinase XerD